MRIGIRAEHVRLHASTDSGPSSLVGEISLIEPLGADTFIEVAVDRNAITCRVDPERSVRLGDRVTIDLPATSLHLFYAQSGDRISDMRLG